MYRIVSIIVLAALVTTLATTVAAQTLPKVSVQVGEAKDPTELSTTLQIIILMTVLALHVKRAS